VTGTIWLDMKDYLSIWYYSDVGVGRRSSRTHLNWTSLNCWQIALTAG